VSEELFCLTLKEDEDEQVLEENKQLFVSELSVGYLQWKKVIIARSSMRCQPRLLASNPIAKHCLQISTP
jgi:hypothetical protein